MWSIVGQLTQKAVVVRLVRQQRQDWRGGGGKSKSIASAPVATTPHQQSASRLQAPPLPLHGLQAWG